MDIHVAPSARRRGLDDADVVHAFNHPLFAFVSHDDLEMIIGPDRAGNVREVGYVVADDGVAVIVHAMRARPAYLDLLR